MIEKLRGYFAYDIHDEAGHPIVARTSKEAKAIAYNTNEFEYVDIRIKWIRNANIENLNVGIVENTIDAIRRGFFENIECACIGCNNFTDECKYMNGELSCHIK